MVLVRVRIYLGKSLLGEPTRPFAPEVTVKAVVDSAYNEESRESAGVSMFGRWEVGCSPTLGCDNQEPGNHIRRET